MLAGGGAMLNGLDERLRHETHMPVHVAESPLTCVAVGSGRSLEEYETLHRSAVGRIPHNVGPLRLSAPPPTRARSGLARDNRVLNAPYAIADPDTTRRRRSSSRATARRHAHGADRAATPGSGAPVRVAGYAGRRGRARRRGQRTAARSSRAADGPPPPCAAACSPCCSPPPSALSPCRTATAPRCDRVRRLASLEVVDPDRARPRPRVGARSTVPTTGRPPAARHQREPAPASRENDRARGAARDVSRPTEAENERPARHRWPSRSAAPSLDGYRPGRGTVMARSPGESTARSSSTSARATASRSNDPVMVTRGLIGRVEAVSTTPRASG